MSPGVEYTIGAPDYPVLDKFIFSNARVSFIMGPLGSGKTIGAIQRLLRHMREQSPNALGVRPTRFIAVRNTYPDLTSTTIKDFREVFRELGQMKWGGLEPPTFHVAFDAQDGTQVVSEMIFLSLDREDDVRKLRGTQVTGFWLNEVRELVKPIVDMADMRHGRYPSMAGGGVKCDWHGMIGDSNAMDQDHWYYRMAEENTPEGWEFYRQDGGLLDAGQQADGRTLWEPNPQVENLKNLPDEYYTTGQRGKSDEWIKVNLANEYGFTVEGKPVHPEYVDHLHCPREDLEVAPDLPLVVGCDFGRTPAAAICQYLEPVGRWHVIDELCTEDMSASLFGPALKLYLDRHYPGMPVQGWGDPAGDKAGQTVEITPIQILRAAGIPCEPCYSNQPTLRRASVANPLTRICMDGRPGLLISRKARMVRKGLMGGFCYRRMKVAGSERYTDEPDKNQYSHPTEALEYALMGGGEGRAAIVPAPHFRDTGPRQEWAIEEPYD